MEGLEECKYMLAEDKVHDKINLLAIRKIIESENLL